MLVRALKSFGGRGPWGSIHVSDGDVFELPHGADWLRAGLVEIYDPETMAAPESAMLPPPEPKWKRTGQRSVQDIDGIGQATADALLAMGIRTIADLAASSEFDLVKLPGVGQATARKWLKAARDLLTG